MLRRRFMMQQIPSSNLPSGYTKLEFIESYKPNFNRYMLIDIDTRGVTKVETEFTYLERPTGEFNTSFLFGWYGSTDGFQLGSKYYDELARFNSASNSAPVSNNELNVIRKVILSNKGYYVNDKLIKQYEVEPLAVTPPHGFPLFGRYGRGFGTMDVMQTMYCRLYSFKLYKEEQVICNLVPCRNTKNVEGVYDTINERFYTWEVK